VIPSGGDIGEFLPTPWDIWLDVEELEKMAHDLDADISKHVEKIRSLICRQIHLGRLDVDAEDDNDCRLPYGTSLRLQQILQQMTDELMEKAMIDSIWGHGG
jgi:hypothetical protein